MNSAVAFSAGQVHNEAVRRILDVGLTGTFVGMRSLIPGMQSNCGAALVNNSSIWGLVAARAQWPTTPPKAV